ncbi:MAG: hypothetical protein JWP95_1477 [Actinotalea sp.]|nr:hypothetical protein [Actinotalea sp.]
MADHTHADQPGTVPGTDQPDTSDAAAGDATDESQDAKTRFREALARKHESAHRSAEGRQNTGVVHGAEVKAGGKRTFRRKTG